MKCLEFREFERNTLRGFAKLAHENGIVLLDCALHEREGKRWCSPPSRPMLDKDRRLVLGEDGKPKYVPLLEFADSKTRSRWSTAAVVAIDEFLKSKAPAGVAGAMNSMGEAPETAIAGAARDG